MFDFLRNITKPAAEKRQERLNAYLDGALSAQEQSRFEKELEQDAELRAELEELRWVKLSVQRVPRVRAPRNFILDPAVYGQQVRQPAARSLYPTLRVATALTAFFFILALALDLATPYGAVPQPLLGSGASEMAGDEALRQADDIAMVGEEQPPEEEPTDGDSAQEVAPFAATEEGEVAAPAEEAAAEIVEEEALRAEEPVADAPADDAEQPEAEEPAMPGAAAPEETADEAPEATMTAEAAEEAAAAAPQPTPAAETESAPFAEATEASPAQEPEADQPVDVAEEAGRSFPYLLAIEVALGVILAALVIATVFLRRSA